MKFLRDCLSINGTLKRLFAILATACSLFQSRRRLTLENLARRQQLAMLKSSVKRPRAAAVDRLFWVLFAKHESGWYMACVRKPPSRTWRTFLDNRVTDLASMDFFTVPTATFRVLYVFIVLRHDRRQIMQLNVSAHPTAQWTAQRIVEAFPFDTAPRYLLRDRDRIYGDAVQRRIKSLGVQEVLTAPRLPW